MKKVNWPDHIVNLIVVITGITIAFWLNNWSEANKENRLQKTYLEFMSSDLSADLQELDSLIIKDSLRREAFHKLMFTVNELTQDSLNWAVMQMGSINIFDGQNTTFESLKSSGKFELMDFNLRLKIIEYYHKGYSRLKEVESYYKLSFDTQIIPYLIREMDMSLGSINRESLLRNEFKVILGIHMGLLDQKIKACKDNLSKGRELLKQFEID